MEVFEQSNGTGYSSFEFITGEIDLGQVEIQVFGDITGEVGMGDGDGPELLQVAENDERASGIDLDVGDGEIGEVLEAAQPDAGEAAEGGDGGEGAEGGDEIGGEADGGDGAVEEVEGLESGEGLEGGEGESDVVGAVGEGEGEEVVEGLGRVAEGGVGVELGAWVFGSWDVEGLEGSYLFGV